MLVYASCPDPVACEDGVNGQVTIPSERLLDGAPDCPLGDDEKVPDVIACRERTREEHCEEQYY